jgi:PAS domain S-box-containing protein
MMAKKRDWNGENEEMIRVSSHAGEQREEVLCQSEEWLHPAMESAKVGVWEWEVGTEQVEWSQGIYALLGYEPGGVTPRRAAFRQRIHPQDLARQDQALKDSLERCEDYVCEFRVVWADGSVHWIEARGQYAYVDDKNGTILRMRGVLSDIDRRKQAEEALHAKDAELESILTRTPFMLTRCSRDLHYRYASRAYAEMIGRTPDQIAGKPILDIMGEEGFQAIRPHVETVLQGQRVEYEATVHFRGVGSRFLRVAYVPDRDQQGQVIGWIASILDLTERKQAEDALRESEQRLALALSGTQVGMYDRDVASGEIRGTEQVTRLLGLRSTTTLSQVYHYHDWVARVHPEDLPRVEAELNRCQANHSACEAEYRVLWPDGSVRWIIDRGVFRYGSDGQCTRMLGILMDITERKQAEHERRERMKELACLYAVSRDIQEDLPIDELCQRAVEHLVAAMQFPEITVPVIELNGRRFALENFTVGLSHGLQAQITVEGEVLGHLRVDYVEERPFLIPEEQNLVNSIAEALGTWLERKQAEEALRELNATLESKVAQRTAELQHRAKQLQKLTLDMSETEDRERQRIAEILHDDLQQQLAGAKFHLGLVRNRVKADPSLRDITAQIDHMLKEAIEKSRNLSHELNPAALHRDLAETLGWLANQVQAKHGLVVHVRANGPVYLQSDGIKAFLYRTAQELLFNVVKHAQVNEARIRVRQCRRWVCLSVSDRGRGFDPQELREAAGVGLLSIRERIELLGGRMKIKSAKGKGSRFLILLPQNETADTGSEVETRSNGRAKGVGCSADEDSGRLRVLLADDHEIVRQGLASLLSEEDTIEIVGEAADGREAVHLTNQLRPDVVIMDVSMPVMSGDEAARQIKQDLPQTRIISLSLFEDPELREKMYQAGAENYVLKTAPSKELLAAIRGP